MHTHQDFAGCLLLLQSKSAHLPFIHDALHASCRLFLLCVQVLRHRAHLLVIPAQYRGCDDQMSAFLWSHVQVCPHVALGPTMLVVSPIFLHVFLQESWFGQVELLAERQVLSVLFCHGLVLQLEHRIRHGVKLHKHPRWGLCLDRLGEPRHGLAGGKRMTHRLFRLRPREWRIEGPGWRCTCTHAHERRERESAREKERDKEREKERERDFSHLACAWASLSPVVSSRPTLPARPDRLIPPLPASSAAATVDPSSQTRRVVEQMVASPFGR